MEDNLNNTTFLSRYVLITPARNEAEHIEKTIVSVISQTITPVRWIIVSDGSTDNTDSIVKRYLGKHPWMELIRMDETRDRSFSAKVSCFYKAYEKLGDIEYDVIGNLDGDISFESDYIEFLLGKLACIPELGVAGTPFIEKGYSSVSDSFEGENHVPGGCQLFRRECFEDIGGYTPVKGGGIDWIAVTTARMKGWKTQSFGEKKFFHYRTLGTADSNVIVSNYNYGKKDYYLGGHPLWEILRVIYRVRKRPYIIGGLSLLFGYLYGYFTNMKRPVSKELMKFHRHEQMQKLWIIIGKAIRFQKINKFELK